MSFAGNIRPRPLTSLLLAGLLACIAPVSQALGTGPPCIEEFVDLTDVAQGNVCQNSYRPQNSDGLPASFVQTARTNIDVNSPTDPNAAGSTGSVVLNSDGTGVKAINCGSGGMAIDGTGNGKDEEVIFTFDNPVSVDKILLGLNQIDFSADEPVLFISGNDGVDYVIEEPEIIAAFTATGPFRGTLDFGALVSVPAGLLCSEFKIRETVSHIRVDEITILCFCVLASDCDDADACTIDECDQASGSCINTPIDVPTVCDDGNACTTESCDPAMGCVNTPDCVLDTDCTDNDACTTDNCGADGCCAFAPIDVPTVCDDIDACTTETCDPLDGCVNTPIDVPTVCDDGNVCTTESCDPDVGCLNTPECVLDTDCDDIDACTTDTCSLQGCCVFTPIDVPTVCDDGDACTAESCDSLIGCVNTPIDVPTVCDDGNVCTTESCDPDVGCLNTPECVLDTDCDDIDACTTDTCSPQGCCVFTPIDVPTVCDDGDACTAESCDSVIGCVNTPECVLDGDCQDGDACTIDSCGADGCCLNVVDGFTVGGAIYTDLDAPITSGLEGVSACVSCDCGFSACDITAGPWGGWDLAGVPAGNCTVMPTLAGWCFSHVSGGEIGEPAPMTITVDQAHFAENLSIQFLATQGTNFCCLVPSDCDDGDACTLDGCQASLCSNTDIDVPVACDDNNVCTAESCDSEVGCVNTLLDPAVDCNDKNACTAESCDPELGCLNTPECILDTDCTDGDACTVDTCSVDGCCVFTPIDVPVECNDDDACTLDDCDPAVGCVNTPIDPNKCDDGVACTIDICDPVEGCIHTPDHGACDDGIGCTDDVCDAIGGCESTPNHTSCDDGVECTFNFCDALIDCQFLPVDNDCNDGVDCTTDSCDLVEGCLNVPDDAACNDGISCTQDLCSVLDGCQSIPNSQACDDGEPCTSDVCDAVLGCLNTDDCHADLDCSGSVGPFDLASLLGAWGTDPGGPPDFNDDGTVGATDLAILLAQWGPCVKFPGACCNVDDLGTCLQLTLLGCGETDGLFLGPGVPCEECPHIACGPDAGDCCIANGTPGCDMDICCNAVCDTLPLCCDGLWDEKCAERAEQVCAACALPPENDDCPNALVILDGDTDFDTSTATTDGPAHEGCQFDGQTYNDIWYDYIASCNQSLTVSTCNQAGYDTDLVVYDGCDCPVSDANLLGCNDDFGAPCEFTSQVTVPVDTGNCYKIRIGGFSHINAGTGTVTITCNQ